MSALEHPIRWLKLGDSCFRVGATFCARVSIPILKVFALGLKKSLEISPVDAYIDGVVFTCTPSICLTTGERS
jgi:hypothetical protein